MTQIFFNLPAPAGNGSGAWVDVSTMGALKTIVSSAILGTVNVEFTNETVPLNATAVCSFPNGGQVTVTLAARWMRVTNTGYRGGGAPNVDVGGNNDGALFANLACPSATGIGAPTDVTLLGQLKTVQVAGTFRGTVSIEITEDNVTWEPVATLQTPGQYTAAFTASFMRVNRDAPLISPGQPIVNVGACVIGGSGGGGSGVQSFQYTVTGAEPDLTQLVIPLPVARASTNYVVVATCNGVTNILDLDCPKTLYTTTQFQLILTSSAQAGDVFGFHVADAS